MRSGRHIHAVSSHDLGWKGEAEVPADDLGGIASRCHGDAGSWVTTGAAKIEIGMGER